MHIPIRIILVTFSAILLLACKGQDEEVLVDTFSPSPSPGQEEDVLADTFFFGCAYLDANNNGNLDDTDPLLKDITFTITLKNGGGFGNITSEDSCTMIWIPGGLEEAFWPVTARVQVPETAGYELTGPEEILLEYPTSHVDFLFSELK